MEVKTVSEFPLRLPEKGMHSIGSDDQFLSKAARCKQKSSLLNSFLRNTTLCHSKLAIVYVLGLRWAPGSF